MPKIAQSYDVNLFIKMFFHLCQICINDFSQPCFKTVVAGVVDRMGDDK
jgi:hypothetical protein